jgi:ATP-binding cassette subfamily B protein
MNAHKYRMIDFILVPVRCIPFQSVFAILYTVLNALMPAYQTVVLAGFIDCATDIFEGKRHTSDILLPIVLIVIYILFTNLMPSVANIVSLTGRNKLTLTLKERILGKKSSLEYMYIENAETQDLINRACDDPSDHFYGGFNNILSATNLIISSVSLMMLVMTTAFAGGIAIVAVTVPLLALASRLGRQNYEMGKEAKKIQRRYGYLASVLTEREYSNERKLFGYSGRLQDRFSELYARSFAVESKIEIKRYRNMKSGSLVTLIVIAVIVLILLPSLDAGKMSAGMFVALVNAVFGLVQSMSWKLAGTMRNHTALQEYLKDFNAFFALGEKEGACDRPADMKDFKLKSLEFRNVSFKYPSTERYILKNCSFVLSGDKSYAFVGVNGAGKSTITKLIAGLYESYDGEILLNGKNIREYAYAEIKGLISVLFQDYSTYAATLKDNIIIGNDMLYDGERLQESITLSGLDGLKEELPYGEETPIGKILEGGVDISGGQRQRIAIARLLYKAAPVNILDEPTASLDPVAESQVYEMFDRVNKGRFTVYITHRLGAAKIADEILVVDGGHIAESGNHEQLMSIAGGLYHTMFDSQRSWYEQAERNAL